MATKFITMHNEWWFGLWQYIRHCNDFLIKWLLWTLKLWWSNKSFITSHLIRIGQCYTYTIRIRIHWAWGGCIAAEVLALSTPGSRMGTGSHQGSSTSHPAPCLLPGKAVEDGPKTWDPAPMWETWKRFLASDLHSSGHCTHLGSESSDGRSSSLSLLLCVYLTL